MGIICLICLICIKDLKAWRSEIKKKKQIHLTQSVRNVSAFLYDCELRQKPLWLRLSLYICSFMPPLTLKWVFCHSISPLIITSV